MVFVKYRILIVLFLFSRAHCTFHTMFHCICLLSSCAYPTHNLFVCLTVCDLCMLCFGVFSDVKWFLVINSTKIIECTPLGQSKFTPLTIMLFTMWCIVLCYWTDPLRWWSQVTWWVLRWCLVMFLVLMLDCLQ